MAMEARITALWPIMAELGAATSLSAEKLPLLRTVLVHLATLCESSVELWCIDAGGALQEDDRWRLIAAARSSDRELPLALLSPPLDDTIHHAALSGRTIVVTDPAPALALPFNVGHHLQGVLLVRAVSPSVSLLDWREVLEQFVPLLGLSLIALDLHTARFAVTTADRLTIADVRSPIRAQLEQELTRARRSRRTFAVLMTSLDQLADRTRTIGIAMRERVMQRLEMVLREACRDSDMVGRYDGERLLLLLPGSDAQGAALVAQRQFDQLYSRPLHFPGYDPLYLDISIGIALFPVDGLTSTELLENAINALTTAQLLGGRRVVAA